MRVFVFPDGSSLAFHIFQRRPGVVKGTDWEPLRLTRAGEPTVLSELGGADQGGDGEAVPGADRQGSAAARHAAGAAAQRHALVRVTVVVPGGGQRQVAAHVLHALAVALGEEQKAGRVISRPVTGERRRAMLRLGGADVAPGWRRRVTLFAFFIQSGRLLGIITNKAINHSLRPPKKK